MSNGPKFSTRLWSEEVGLADPGAVQGPDVSYRFSSGRTFSVPTDIFQRPWPPTPAEDEAPPADPA